MSRRGSSLVSKRLKSTKGKKKNAHLYLYGTVVGSVLVIIFGIIFLARSHAVRVQTVVISGNEIVKKEEIEKIVTEARGERFLWIIPKDDIILFPREDVTKKILEQYPTIANASVSFSGLHTLAVVVREYKPRYLWCDSVKREKCYFMDDRGYIFTEAAGFSEGVLFTYYGLIDPAQPIGNMYLPLPMFTELNKFAESLKLLKVTPVGLNVLGQDDFELHLSTGSTILFSNREDFLQTFANLETIIAEQTRLNKNFLAELDYIDVRFTSKAFVKLK